MNNRAISLPDLAAEKKTGLQQLSMGCHGLPCVMHVVFVEWGLAKNVELRKRNTAASLSEGFAGSHHKGAKTSQCVASFLCCFLVQSALSHLSLARCPGNQCAMARS